MRIIEGSAEIKYPTDWQYKLIGQNKEVLSRAVDAVLDDERYRLEDSKRSSGGKYVSLNLTLTVASQDERDTIYRSLKSHNDILMVL